MNHPKAVANQFLDFGRRDGIPITPMKLLKLVYISHGWHLGLTHGDGLVNEAVEAWKYGPVIPSIYRGVSKFGNSNISEFATRKVLNASRKIVDSRYKVNDDSIVAFLEQIWGIYKKYSGVELSMMTHREGTPWYVTWHQKDGKNIRGKDIDNELIQHHYEQLFRERSQETAGTGTTAAS